MGVHEMEWASGPCLRSMPCVICQSLMVKIRFASCSSERGGGYVCEKIFTGGVSREAEEESIMPFDLGLPSNGLAQPHDVQDLDELWCEKSTVHGRIRHKVGPAGFPHFLDNFV